MANSLKVLDQKRGVNFASLAVAIALSGNYVQGTGEAVSFQAGSMPNPNAESLSGPTAPLFLPPRITVSTLGGYKAELTLVTAATNTYKLQFWTSGGTELAAGAYPASISGGSLVVELDYNTGHFDS